MIRGRTNNSGIILMVVLWVMAILSLLAIGLGWQTHIELTLAKNLKGKNQSKYAALSGLAFAMDKFQQNQVDKDLHKADIFNPLLWNKEVPYQQGYFKVTRFIDEAAKLNINTMTEATDQIFIHLLMNLGVPEDTATTIASSTLDWKDENSDATLTPYGAENDYYQAHGYACKNKSFDSIEELMLVRGMTPEIFQKIKKFITVTPAAGSLAINLDDAPPEILRAFADSLAGPQTNTSLEDASSLVSKIINYRLNLKDEQATAQERALEANKLGLNSSENALFLTMQSQRQKERNLIHVETLGVDPATGASTSITATFKADDLSILSWHRN